MKKNYREILSLSKPGILIVFLILFYSYGHGQSINSVQTNKVKYCSEEVIEFTFIAENGNGRRRFDNQSDFNVEVIGPSGSVFNFSFNSNEIPVGNWNSSTITDSPPIEIDASWAESDQYRIVITSTNPNVNQVYSETFKIQQPSTAYNETEVGQNSWIGHIYDVSNRNIKYNQEFTNYLGGYTQNLSFDQNFGGNDTDFQIGTEDCAPFVNTQTFSVRYRMNTSLDGLYYINIGSDDGSRLAVDGELIYNDWNDHGYRNQNVLINFSGDNNLVLDYYENGGGNRITVGEPQLLIKNILSTNINQTLDSQNQPVSISGDEFEDMPQGISPFANGYQWVYSARPDGPITQIRGANSAIFTPNRSIEPFNTEGTYYLYRIATLTSSNNRLGSAYRDSIVSNAALVTVQKPIDITGQPANANTCTGNQVEFSVTASGQNLTYQWQRNNGGNSTNFFRINNGTNFQNTNTSDLVVNIGNSDNWLNDKRFQVVITDENGNSVTSDSAILNVIQSPQGVYTQPSNQIACEGNTVSFQTYTSNDQRQWQVSEDNGSSWSDITNNTFYQNVNSERLDISNTPVSFDNNLYRIGVSNQNCTVYSQPASLQVDIDPITRQPQDVTAAFGNNAIIDAEVTGENLSYQWQTFSSNWYDLRNSENYNGTTTNRLELITVGYAPIDGSRYRLLVTNENGCVSISETAFLNVGENQCENLPTVNLNAPSTICPGQVNINGSFTGTGPWNVNASINGQVFNLNISERNFSYPLNVQENTLIEILNITDSNACENTSPNASVSINVIDQIENNTISGAQEFCGTFDTKLIEGQDLGTGYTYQWELSTTGNNSGFNLAPGINDQPDYDPDSITQTTWFRRKVNVQNCTESVSNVIEVTVSSTINNNDIALFNGNSESIQVEVDENQTANFVSPEGSIFTYINFASYGTPEFENGDYEINENCHSGSSQSIVENNLLGEENTSIAATNANFSDPCVGIFKRLAVTATYSEAFCQGSDPGIVIGTEITGSNISYLWELSTSGASSGFNPAPGVNDQKNYEPGNLQQDIWLKRTVISGSCSSTSPVLYLPLKEENVWTGVVDTDWNTLSNWSCNSLPTFETNVLIPENLSSGNYPVITAGNNALAKNLIIENNASLEVIDNWLRISDTLINHGVLNAKSGSISLEGTNTQTIPAAVFKDNLIENLRIDNTNGVNSNAVIQVTGILKVVDGDFNTGNHLTLISDENQTALIDGSGNGQVNGLVTMQRYLDKAFGYKYFSSPFQNSVVGDFGPYMNFSDPVSGFPHFYRYNENRNVAINDTVRDATGWEPYTDESSALTIAEGYALNFGSSSNPKTIELTGIVNNGVVPVKQLDNNHRKYTKGFHLVGNPYPSPIDWNASSGWTKSNIDDAIYFFTASNDNQYTGTYTAFVNDISTGGSLVDGRSSNIIPSMQGFFIKVSDSETQDLVTGNFGMTNDVRVTDFDQEFLRTQEFDQRALLRLEAGFQNASLKDPMVIYFSSLSSLNFEKEMDAHKLMNTDPAVPNFYNITENGKQLAINAIPHPETKSYNRIQLGIKAEKAGSMIINLNTVENISPNLNIYLLDYHKGIGQNLSRRPDYIFEMGEGTFNKRFELLFSEEEVKNPAIAFNKPFDVETRNGNIVVKLNLENDQSGILRSCTLTGQILQVKQVSEKEEIIITGIKSEGVYIINLQVGKSVYSKKVVLKK